MHQKLVGVYPTFSNSEMETAFARNGYLILPYLEASQIPEILYTFQQLSPSDSYRGMQETAIMQQSFHVTFFDKNVAYRNQVFALAKNLFQDFAQTYLTAHKMIQGNVFLKPPGQGFVFPHQNLTITDETQYRSVSIWCPLQDTNFENGTLCVVPGSQNGFMRYRNTNVEWPLLYPFLRDGIANPFLIPLEVKAGEVVVLDDRLIHLTPENQAQQARWVLHSLWLPQDAPLRYFDVDFAQIRVSEYEVDQDFWQLYAPGTQPNGLHCIGTFPYSEPSFTEAELIARLEQLKMELNASNGG